MPVMSATMAVHYQHTRLPSLRIFRGTKQAKALILI